jgi:hypothetical protein
MSTTRGTTKRSELDDLYEWAAGENEDPREDHAGVLERVRAESADRDTAIREGVRIARTRGLRKLHNAIDELDDHLLSSLNRLPPHEKVRYREILGKESERRERLLLGELRKDELGDAPQPAGPQVSVNVLPGVVAGPVGDLAPTSRHRISQAVQHLLEMANHGKTIEVRTPGNGKEGTSDRKLS